MKHSRILSALGGASLLLATAACGGSEGIDPGADWLIVLRGSDPGTANQLVAVSAAGDEVALAQGFEVIREPCLSHCAMWVAFGGRRSGGAEALYVLDLADLEIEELATDLGAVQEVAFLPRGDLVFRVAGADGEADVLYAAGGERPEPCRISFGTGRYCGPILLNDGRLLLAAHSEGEAPDRLLALHPDGTGLTTYAELRGDEPWRVRRVRADGSGDLVVLAESPERDTACFQIDVDVPAARGVMPLSLQVPAARDFDLAPNGALLLACADGVYRVAAGEESAERLLATPSDQGVQAVLAVEARPRPDPHLSLVNPQLETAEIFCVSVRRSQRAAVREADENELAQARFLSAGDGEVQVVAEVPIWPDGSFYTEVPGNVALRVELVDGRGRVIAAEHHSFWMRPGERRGCIGCHEDRLSASPNQMPAALGVQPEVEELVKANGSSAMENPR